MLLPSVIFLLFALLAAAGAYLGGARYRGPRGGVVAALAALIFFVALYAGLVVLLRSGGAL
jgi:hypothetical protein